MNFIPAATENLCHFRRHLLVFLWLGHQPVSVASGSRVGRRGSDHPGQGPISSLKLFLGRRASSLDPCRRQLHPHHWLWMSPHHLPQIPTRPAERVQNGRTELFCDSRGALSVRWEFRGGDILMQENGHTSSDQASKCFMFR